MSLGTIGLSTYRWNNSYKALILVVLFPLIAAIMFWWQIYVLVWLDTPGYIHTAHSYLATKTDSYFYGAAGVAFAAALLFWLIYSWYNHSSIIRSMALSKSVDASTEPRLYAILESVCISQGIPTFDLEIMEIGSRNSFVCSDGEGTSRVFVTRGLLEALSADEIEAVIAHEIAHILNNDSRLLSFTIAFCDLYPYLRNTARKPRLDEAPAATRYPEIKPDEIGVTIIIFLLLTPLWIAYILTSIVRVVLFINREHDADAMAIQITKNPDALMRALKRIHRRARLPYGSHDIKFLCIDNPEGGVFATHPRLWSRLALISELGNCPVPDVEDSEAAPVHKRFKENPLLKRVFKPRDPNAPKPFNAPWK